MDENWIKLNKQIQDCFLWDEKPFDKARAWIDLLLLVSHKESMIGFKGEPVTVYRGQYMTSIRELSSRWGWSKDKVLHFLKMLETEEMLLIKHNKKGTLLTVVNYDTYQE